MKSFVPFGQIWPRVREILESSGLDKKGLKELWVVRDLMGRIRLLISEEAGSETRNALIEVARRVYNAAPARAYEPDRSVLAIEPEELELLRRKALREELGELVVYLVDRVVSAAEWGAVSPHPSHGEPLRFTLFALKGGTGRSTTAAVMAHHLGLRGDRVLVVDLDLESPGVSSMLLVAREHPEFGVVDWFVEDLVGQGEEVLEEVVGRPAWARDLPGDVLVVPAYGRAHEDYLPKLGRVYLDLPTREEAGYPERWTARLRRFLRSLEERFQPDIVLLDTRSGLHDLAAAAVTDVPAHVLLFAVDSRATWVGYRILFQYWRDYAVAREIRGRLSMVAALVPETRPRAYLERVREQSWDLFRDHLYDEVPAGADEWGEDGPFSFDRDDEAAPHYPLPIYWAPGLAALSSYEELDSPHITAAYEEFFKLFASLVRALREARDGD